MEKRRDLERGLEELAMLQSIRSTSKKLMSTCSLVPQHGILLLKTQKGRHWQVHAHAHLGSMYLLIEEALFLNECGVLEICVDGIPMSLQQAYHSITSLPNGLSLVLYQVYATLKRCGYVVVRRRLIGFPALSLLPVCPLCRADESREELNCTKGTDLLQVHHSSPGFSKTKVIAPICSVILCSPSDQFPSPHILHLEACQPLVVAVAQADIVSFYKLTFSNIETIT